MYNNYGNPESDNFDHREKLKGTIQNLLGGSMADVEVSDEQYELAIDMAIENYRAWASNSKEEAFLHFKLLQGETVYTLPQEIEIVRKVYRRGNGVVNGSGSTTDPFSLAYSNSYLLSVVRGNSGSSLLTYDLYHQFDETAGRLFGRDINFLWNPVTKKLTLERDIRGDEEVLLHVYQNRPEPILFQHQLIYPWIRDWALAEVMLMLGRIRGKFASLPGPQGTWSNDGESLKQEAQQLKEQLKTRLRNYEDGSTPLGFIIG